MQSIRISLIAVVFALVLSATAGTVLAQEQPAPEQPAPEQTAPEQPAPDPSAQEQELRENDLDQLIAALNGTVDEILALQAADSLTAENVRFVSVKDVVLERNESVLNETIEVNREQIEELRGVLSANELLISILEENERAVEDVIAIDISEDGSLTVYYLVPEELG